MLRAVNTTRGTTLGDCVSVADTSFSRFWGLLGKRGLDAGRGLWIKPSSGVHTVGMMFTIDDGLVAGSFLDYGMFLQNITVLARSARLDTCVQAAFGMFPRIVRPLLGIPDSELVLCGMALGYADPSAPENALVSERAPIDSFVTFYS